MAMKSVFIRGIVITLGLALALGLAWWINRGEAPDSAPLAPVRLALPMRPATAAAFIAADSGLYAREGLTVTLRDAPSGVAAMKMLLAGEAEIAFTAETPVALAALRGDPIVVLASIYESLDHNQIIARRDRGIAAPADLAGKRLGYQPGTSTAYFAAAYLLAHGIPDVRRVEQSLGPRDMSKELLEGRIDAAVLVPPYNKQTAAALGTNGLVLRDPSLAPSVFCLVATRAWAEANPQAVRRLLAALIAATGEIRAQPEASLTALARIFKLEQAELRLTWDPGNLAVRLHPTLRGILEEQARWALKYNLVPATSSNERLEMADLLWAEPLRSLDPAAVTLRR